VLLVRLCIEKACKQKGVLPAYSFDFFTLTGNFADAVTNSAYAVEAITVDGAATWPSCSNAFSWRRNDGLGLKF